MKFIHTADLHLGYKFSSEYSEDTLNILKSNQKKVLSNIIDLGNDKKIDALFISGDLFDTPVISKELLEFVKKEFERAIFEIFIIGGNHDPLVMDSLYIKEEFPKNCHIFTDKDNCFSLSDSDIYGFSFSQNHKLESSLLDFKLKNPDKINIVLAHGDISKDSYYNPMSLADIRDTNADYVALGHIHLECDINKAGNTYYGYSGTPQGSTFKEADEVFVILGELEKGFLKFEKIPVYEHIYKNLSININMPYDNMEIIEHIRKELSLYNVSRGLFNIRLNGFISDSFTIDKELIINELKKNLLHLRIDFDLHKKYNIDLLKEEQSVRGEFVRNALKELSDKDEEYILKVIEYGVSQL